MTSPAAVGRRRVFADILVQVFGYGLNLSLGVVTTLVLTRALGSHAFGQWATLLILMQLVEYVQDPGLEAVAVREAAADPDAEPRWIGALLSLNLVLGVVALAVYAGLVVAIANGHAMRISGALLGSTLLLGGVLAVSALTRVHVRNDLRIAVVTANSVLWTIAVVILAGAGSGMVVFAAVFAAVTWGVAAVEFGIAFRVASIRVRGTRDLWAPMLRAGIAIGVADVLVLAYGRVDQILVFTLSGDRDAGLYGAVYRVLSQGSYLPIAVTTTLYPLLAAAGRIDTGRMHRLLSEGFRYLMMAALPALAFAIFEATPLVKLLFGPAFADAAPAFPILMAAFIPVCIWYLASTALVALHQQRRLLAYDAAVLLLNVALNLALIPTYGFVAAAWTTLATELLAAALATRAALRETALRIDLGALARTMLATAALAVGLLVTHALGGQLAVAAVAAAIIYPAALVATRAITIGEVVSLLRRTRPPADLEAATEPMAGDEGPA